MKGTTEMNQVHNDDIDVFELFQVLWDGKWIISAFAVLATLIGFGYSQVVQPKYDVSVTYNFNSHIKSSREENLQVRLLTVLGGDWEKHRKSPKIVLSTTAPLSESEYEAQVERVNSVLTKEIYADALAEILLLETDMPKTLMSTERVATDLSAAKNIVRVIDGGQEALSFGSVSVNNSSPKAVFRCVFSFVLGVMLGAVLTVVRHTVKRRKKYSAKA